MFRPTNKELAAKALIVGDPVFWNAQEGVVFKFAGVVVLPVAADDLCHKFDSAPEGDNRLAGPKWFLRKWLLGEGIGC